MGQRNLPGKEAKRLPFLYVCNTWPYSQASIYTCEHTYLPNGSMYLWKNGNCAGKSFDPQLYNHAFTNRDLPVISLGCSNPISSIRVGAISARQPPSLSLYPGSAFTRIKGTGFVVWAVNGSPVS